MRKVNLIEFSDLLMHAQTIGYNWNQAHEILVKDEVPPMAECRKTEIHISDIDQNGWSADTQEILRTYFEAMGVEEFTMTA